MTNGIIANIIIPINPIILSLIGFIMNTSLLKKGEQRLTNFDPNHKLALNKTFVNTLAPLLCKVWRNLTQKTKMEVLHSTNLSLFFCSFRFRTLNHQSLNISKRLHNSQRFQDGPTLFLKLRKQQYILRFLTNHSRF